jgi:hypothetical protein
MSKLETPLNRASWRSLGDGVLYEELRVVHRHPGVRNNRDIEGVVIPWPCPANRHKARTRLRIARRPGRDRHPDQGIPAEPLRRWSGAAEHGPHQALNAELVALSAQGGDVSTQDVQKRFVAALGGTLKLIADFSDERLRSPDRGAKRGASDRRLQATTSDVGREKPLAGQCQATPGHPRCPHGMQEVWGSNPHSSTSKVRAVDSNSCREAAFSIRARVRSSGSADESANEQVRGGSIVPRFVLRELLPCRQAVREEPWSRCRLEAIIERR